MDSLDTPDTGKVRLFWFGGTAAIFVLLQFFQQTLDVFHLRVPVLILVSLLLLMLGALLNGLQELLVQRGVVRDLSGAFDAMLSCSPPRGASKLDPYDVGVRPDLRPAGATSGAGRYIPRDTDPKIADALEREGIVVVLGPGVTGKSRSAYQAVRDRLGDAPMIVPASAEGLAALIRKAADLRLFQEQSTILWLDGLERFVAGLDFDRLDALVHPRPPEGQLRRAWTHIASLVRRLFRRPPAVSGRPPMKVVATVRESELRRLLEGSEEATHTTRRFMAHARGVPMKTKLSVAERNLFEKEFGQPPKGTTVATAFPSAWRPGWERRAARFPDMERPNWLKNPGLPIGRFILVAVLGTALWLVAADIGWQDPPPVEDQVADLTAATRPCETADFFPPDGKGLSESGNGDRTGDVLVEVVKAGDCPASDEVRFYRLQSGRLKQFSALRLPPKAVRHTFSCIGSIDDDPCHVSLSGSATAIVGAFRNTETEQEMPVVVSFAKDEVAVSALTPPAAPPANISPTMQRLGRQEVKLQLLLGTSVRAARAAAAGRDCREAEGCVRGQTAQATAVLAKTPSHPPALVAGYVSAGTADAPEGLEIRAWRIQNTETIDPRAQHDRDCLVLRHGRPAGRELVTSATADLRHALLHAAQPENSALMC